jgi:hypothetical protein
VAENPGQGPRGSHNFDELARGLASGSVSRRRALKLFAGAAVGALIPSRALAQPCLPPKEEICHKPVGRPAETLCVGPNAADRHIAEHRGPLVPVLTLRARARHHLRRHLRHRLRRHLRHHQRRRLRHHQRRRHLLRVRGEGNGAGRTARTVAATWCAEESQVTSVAVEEGATTTIVAGEGNGAGGTARTVAATWCAEESQEISVAVEGGATTINGNSATTL